MKHVLRYTMKCRLGADIEYDPTKPETYTAALQAVQAKKKALEDLGADMTAYSVAPAKIKDGA